jgi:GNAT superfamily N-acetyltransferase
LNNIIKALKYSVRPAYREEWDDAMALAWRTFMRFEAKDYTLEGIESFQNFITDSILHRMFLLGEYQLFVAYAQCGVVGLITLRSQTHISLLFVEERYHRRGIGSALLRYVCDYVKYEEGHDLITVNAAPYATEFYHKFGFVDTGELTWNDGIYYTPMEFGIR